MLSVKLLQGVHRERSTLDSGDSLDSGAGSRDGSDDRNALRDSGTSDCFLIKVGIHAEGRIDDQMNLATFDEIDNVGAAFFDLVNTLYYQASILQSVGSPVGRDQVEAKLRE